MVHARVGQQIILHPFGSRKHTHATGAKGFEQGAVLKFTHNAGPYAALLKPQVEPGTHCRMTGWQ